MKISKTKRSLMLGLVFLIVWIVSFTAYVIYPDNYFMGALFTLGFTLMFTGIVYLATEDWEND